MGNAMNGWLVLRQTLVLHGKECELVRGECEVPVTYLPAGYVSPMARSSYYEAATHLL